MTALQCLTCSNILKMTHARSRWSPKVKIGRSNCVMAGACTWPWRQQDVVNRQLSTHYTFRQLKEKLQVADFASERMTYFNTLLFPAIATIRLIARYGRRLHWEEGNPAYARKVIKCGLAQPVCRTGFLEIACDCPSSVWYPDSDSCGRTAGCGSQTGDPQQRHCSERGRALFSPSCTGSSRLIMQARLSAPLASRICGNCKDLWFAPYPARAVRSR